MVVCHLSGKVDSRFRHLRFILLSNNGRRKLLPAQRATQHAAMDRTMPHNSRRSIGESFQQIMKKPEYSALEPINPSQPVDRIKYISSLVKSKTVFDLGALDETALNKKSSDRWLHAKICESAKEVIGIDNSMLLPSEGISTATNGRIIRADIFNLSPVIGAYGKPDTLVAGELIEHLPNTLEWLRSLKKNQDLAQIELIFSTPNACNWHNGVIGVIGRESMHKDHLQIYSYKTLLTLFDRAEIDLLSLTPYHARFDEMLETSSGLKKIAVGIFQNTINILEKITPALAGGWVGRARI